MFLCVGNLFLVSAVQPVGILSAVFFTVCSFLCFGVHTESNLCIKGYTKYYWVWVSWDDISSRVRFSMCLCSLDLA